MIARQAPTGELGLFRADLDLTIANIIASISATLSAVGLALNNHLVMGLAWRFAK